MNTKNKRLETIKALISSRELGNQEEVLAALRKEGFHVTQATLSRDLKQLKVAKAASTNGSYVYVLPNFTLYKRVSSSSVTSEMKLSSGFKSLTYSRNVGVIKTKPGYASSIAYNIDNSPIQGILGTIAGDDTIIFILSEDADREAITTALNDIVPSGI